MNKQTYSIGDASKKTGVSLKKLRSWESRYIPEPERIVCGERSYRRYTQDQIYLIIKIKEYQDMGFLLPVAVKKANEDISRQEPKAE